MQFRYFRTRHLLRPWLPGLLIGLCIIVISTSTRSYILKYLFSESQLMQFWLLCFLGYLVCQTTTILGRALADYAYQHYVSVIHARFMHHVRKYVKHHNALDMSTVESYRVMDKIRTLESTFTRITHFIIYRLIYVILYMAVTFFMVYFENTYLAWILLAAYTVCLVSTGCREWWALRSLGEDLKKRVTANRKLFNTLRNLSTAWYFFEPHDEGPRWSSQAYTFTSRLRARITDAYAYRSLIQNLVLICMSSVVVGSAMFFYVRHQLPFGAFFMIFFLNLALTDQVYSCMKHTRSFLRDVYEFRKTVHVVPQSNNIRRYATLQDPCGEIRFERVSFRYPEGPWIMQDVSMTIPGKACCVITGPLGCGKSTFLQLCAGILKPEKGSIFIDNLPQTEMKLSLLDHLISYVGEVPCVWPETIEHNLRPMPHHSVSSETMKNWCAQCGIEAWISGLSDGYHHVIQDPEHLSFAQRQTVSILRGLGKTCPILILDYLPLQNDAIHIALQDLTYLNPQHRTILRTAHHKVKHDFVLNLADWTLSNGL